MKTRNLAAAAVLTTALGFSQHADSPSAVAPLYRVTVVERTVKAINYQYRSGPTMIDFTGTVLLPRAKGTAIVESKQGRTAIDASIKGLLSPQRFGSEYLTYVLWAITPEGRPHNIGELIPGSSDSVHVSVTTDLQAFALIVTAEPYSAVRTPSDVVVAENQVRPDTEGIIKPVQAKYELLPRGEYTWNRPSDTKTVDQGPKVSSHEYQALTELYEARNAIGIASSANAEHYAPDTYARAQQQLTEAERLHGRKADYRMIVQRAREAAQTAEDARVIAQRRNQEDHLRSADAEVSALHAELAKAQHEQEQAQLERSRAVEQAREAQAQADQAAARARAAVAARDQAEAESQSARQVAAEAERRSQESHARAAQEQQQLAEARKRELRMRLVEDLKNSLPTLDTGRGVVATIPMDAFRGATLTAAYVDRVRRVADVLVGHPELHISVEGYSDKPSGDLPGERAEEVRRVLVTRGVAPGSVTAAGLGDSRPLGPNTTAQGRNENQRVEVVITGDSIGNLALWQQTYTFNPPNVRRP